MQSRRSQLLSSAALAFALVAGLSGSGRANDSLLTASADPNNWAMYGHGYDNTRFSPLTQINPQNAAQLKLAFAFQLGSLRSNESTPIVIGDTMYVSTSWGPKYVYALDARTGQKKWQYEADIPDDVMQYGCCDVVNRGVTYADGKIFVGRLDGKLSTLDAKTGEELWTADVVDYKQGSIIGSPPLVVKNLVLTGFGGGEYGARGSIQAYDIETGKEVWKTWTIPGPGEPGNDTWKGDSWQHGGGVAWLIGSYDPKTNTVFYGTSNPSPWNASVRSTGTSDYGKLNNLYTSSTLAIDADSGKIKWYLQSTPEDSWDYDGVNEAVLADLKMDGQTVPVMLKADRNGFFYVANRESGKLISAEKYVPTSWAEKIDVATAKPVEVPGKRASMGHPAKDICPNLIGGKNWQPMSYNPGTGFVYIPSNNLCMGWSVSEV
ncbi:MAG: PQQ-dependent dehydrogenase, methanol/ethanol family, partial [Alphaproteobacteria bacterium]|nr:PQQ-dependent dehydrogenase, methanol/ethanol family [Alphaproteobacteria bacterium]